jgi:hypothetical protein
MIAQSLATNGALHVAQSFAGFAQSFLRAAGYDGPVGVAGGFVRDIATNRFPKDADLFLDSAFVNGQEHAEEIGKAMAIALGNGASTRVLNAYAWTKDVAYVAKVEFDPDQDQRHLYAAGVALPWGLDCVVLARSRMEQFGYDPATPETYLSAVLSRVDTRLNAIGATPTMHHRDPMWDADVEANRIVIRHARYAEDPARIAKRVSRLAADKYKSWSIHLEQPDGSIRPFEPS